MGTTTTPPGHGARRAPGARRPARARCEPARRRRRRLGGLLAAAGLTVVAAVTLIPRLGEVAQEITLPLRHEDIIRQQAAEEDLDPALVAGVIHTESRFRDQTSPAGARGLMQITPATARYIANLSGGTRFVTEDLAIPQVNISYGTFYLRYLLDRYGGDEVVALAAYNGGETNVDRWLANAEAEDRGFDVEAIPFPETRAYVGRVLDAQEDYAQTYPRELGLD